MIPFIKLDERLHFYKDVLEQLFDYNLDLCEQLRIIQKYKLPSTLASIVSHVGSLAHENNEADIRIKKLEILQSCLNIEGIFDSWDCILILAYIRYIEFGFIDFYSSSDKSRGDMGSVVLDYPEVKDILEQLDKIAYELKQSISYLISDLRFEQSQRQSDSDALYDFCERFSQFLDDYIWDCHDYEEGERLRAIIIKNMISLYKSLDSIDGEQFKNMYENLGYIEYHGGDHGLYQMAQEQIRCDLWDEISKLDFNQKVSLVDQMSLDTLTKGMSIYDLEDFHEFKERVLNSDIIDEIVEDLRKEFLRQVPKYFPD